MQKIGLRGEYSPDKNIPVLLAIGYVSTQLVCETEIDAHSFALARIARLRGHLLCALHVERSVTFPDAFQALVEQADRERIRMILVPSLHHLAPLGAPVVVRKHLEHFLGGKVAVGGYPSSAGLMC